MFVHSSRTELDTEGGILACFPRYPALHVLNWQDTPDLGNQIWISRNYADTPALEACSCPYHRSTFVNNVGNVGRETSVSQMIFLHRTELEFPEPLGASFCTKC